MSDTPCPNCPYCDAKGEFTTLPNRKPGTPEVWRCTGCGITSLYYPPPKKTP